MRPRFVTIFAIAVAVALLTAATFATGTTDVQTDTMTYYLESVIVYGVGIHNPEVVTEITADQIRERNAATVADALRGERGITATSGPKSECDTKIRGFPASDILVLVDGRPINPGYYGKVDLAMLPVGNIAKIEIIKGPVSAAYGANGMGGVINIITRNGSETPQTSVSSEFGGSGYRMINLNHSRQVGKVDFWLSAYENRSRGFRLSDDFKPTALEDGGTRNSSSFRKAGFDGKFGLRPTPQSRVAMSFGYHWAEKDVSPTIYPWDGPSYRGFPDWKRFSLAVNGYTLVRSRLELKGALFADAYADRFVSYLNSTRSYDQIEYDSKLENWTSGGTIDARLRLSENHRLHTGITLKTDIMNKKPDVDQPWFSRRVLTGSLYIEDSFQPASLSEITLGLGYHYFRLRGSNNPTSLLCPVVSLSRQLPLMLRAHAGFSRAARFPNIHQLYGETSGNESLLPEQADKYEIGLKRWFSLRDAKDYVALEVVFFHNKLKNLIYRESRSYQFRNIGKAELQGWELVADWTFRDVFHGDVSYSQVRETDPEKKLMEEIPENVWRWSLSFRSGFGTEINYRYSHLDRRTTYLAGFMLPAHDVHDVNISQEVTRFMTLRIQITNLSDEYYEEELGYPAPGRQITIGLHLRM